ncbi:hypothetical protein V8D89_015936 [Ganoderma adspersum]
MTSPADTSFTQLHARIEGLSFGNKTPENIRALKWHFILLLRGLSDFSRLPDTYFKRFHAVLLKNVDNNLIMSQSINNFLQEYSTESHTLRVKYFECKQQHAKATLDSTKQEVDSLHNAANTSEEGNDIDATVLEEAAFVREQAEQTLQMLLIYTSTDKAVIRETETVTLYLTHNSQCMDEPSTRSLAPKSNPPTIMNPVSTTRHLTNHVSSTMPSMNPRSMNTISALSTSNVALTTKAQQKSGDKSKQIKYEDLLETLELVAHRDSLVSRDLLLSWTVDKCDMCFKSNTDCVPSMDHGRVTCDRCRHKHWKCTCFGRNSRGEIKGKEKNIPWAVFNGVGHLIYKKVPKDYLLWVEACCRAVESLREASAVTVIWPKGIAAVLKNGKFHPSGKGLTEYRYNPATLPKYNPRKMPKCKIVKGAQLISRSQNDDDGDEEEDEGEAPEGQEAEEQDEEDALGSSSATGDHVSEQAEEELDNRDDSEESAVDTMPCKRSSHHISRIYKRRCIDSSPADNNDVDVIKDHGDQGPNRGPNMALELQAALDISPYNDELMDLMNFHMERTWPEITAEDAQEREESTFNNTAPEGMTEQVDQMVQQDVVSRQAEDGEQPTANASATNAPDILGIDPAEYDAPAIHRDNWAFTMRINSLRTMHQALLSEEMTARTLWDRIECTERALTNMLFGKFSSTHIYPYDVHVYSIAKAGSKGDHESCVTTLDQNGW